MRNILRLLFITALTGLLLCSYSDAATKKTQKPMPTSKGAQYKMKTYYMGRFAIDLPEEFKLEIQSQKVRYAEVSDFKWKDKDRDKERNALWAQKIEEIKKLKLPKGKDKIIIEEKELKGIGNWATAVEYYGDTYDSDYLYWCVLVDYGSAGIWLKLYSLNSKLMIKNFTDLLPRYQYGFNNLTKNSFCLQHGRIELAYDEHERTYARFAGPMGMKLRIEMNETHEVEEVGVLDRLVASLATNFAPGVAVNRIRTGKRKVADMSGQEIIIRGTENKNSELFFAWDYHGKEDSGEYPEMKIGIECADGNLDEKMKIWDHILDSFRPAYTR